MTETERDLLMPFLRNLVQTKTTPGDEAARNLIQTALQRQPNANYLLVQRALSLECDLATARRRILQLEGQEPLPETAPQIAPQYADFLNPQRAGWGEPVNHNAGVTSSKRLYDFFKQSSKTKQLDLESRAVIYIGNHAGRIWLFILLLTAAVVMFKEKLI